MAKVLPASRRQIQTDRTAGKLRAHALGKKPAITLSIAKRPRRQAIRWRTKSCEGGRRQGRVIPADVASRHPHYGETAAEKSNELLLHMGIAVVGVMSDLGYARLAESGSSAWRFRPRSP